MTAPIIFGKDIDYKIVATPFSYNSLVKEYNTLVMNRGTEKELESILSSYDAMPVFVHEFLRARYFEWRGDYASASKYIDAALIALESASKEDKLFLDVNRDYLSALYESAGEIYANSNQAEKALYNYQDYQLTVLRIKKDDVGNGILSFRRFNEHT